MIRTAFTAAFLFYFAFSSGQTYLFVRGGITYSLLQQPIVVIEEISVEPRFSNTVEAGVRKVVKDHIGISAGVSYTGYTTYFSQLWGSAGASGTTDYHLYLRYCRLSVVGEYSFGPGKNIFVYIGPFFSVMTSARVKGTWDGRRVDGYTFHHDYEENLYHDLRHFDVGLTGNAGIKIDLGKGFRLSPQIGVSHGFIALKKMDNPHGGSTMTAHYQGIHMSALYLMMELNIIIKDGKK